MKKINTKELSNDNNTPILEEVVNKADRVINPKGNLYTFDGENFVINDVATLSQYANPILHLFE